jgi:hypothetical protein
MKLGEHHYRMNMLWALKQGPATKGMISKRLLIAKRSTPLPGKMESILLRMAAEGIVKATQTDSAQGERQPITWELERE